MGVWIETQTLRIWHKHQYVTPCMGVWIETICQFHYLSLTQSHPVWVCGLKLVIHADTLLDIRHTLYGCVD